MARRRAPAPERHAPRAWAAYLAALEDDYRRRLGQGQPGPSPATVAALAELDDDEAAFVLALADDTLDAYGSVVEILEARFGRAEPPQLPDTVPLAVVEDE